MAYIKTVWVNGTTPAINDTNLNKIEQGIYDSLRQDGTTAMSAQLVTVAGDATTPAIAPTGDSNTGIFFPAANSIGITIDGSERVRFKSNGFVGVGDLDPSYRLDVVNYAATPLRVQRSGEYGEVIKIGRAGVGDTAGISYPADGTFQITTAATPRITINSSGNVGIGTTAPSAKLELSDGTITLQHDLVAGGGYVGTKSNHPLVLFTNNTEKVRITTAGNVGIGTTAPSHKLHVTDSSLTSTTVGANVVTRFQSNGTAADCSISFSNGVDAITKFGQNAGNFVWLSDNTTERMRLTSTGYLLIGYTTSNGAYPLQVNGQIFATSSTIATSDQRYKENVTPLTGALSLVNALNPVQFDWKQHPVHNFNTEQPTVGFLAQEVAEVLKDQPYLNSVVKKSECTWETETGEFVDVTKQVEVDGELVDEVTQEAVKETHTEEFYGIAESNLIAILTKAVQELSAEVQTLKAQIASK